MIWRTASGAFLGLAIGFGAETAGGLYLPPPNNVIYWRTPRVSQPTQLRFPAADCQGPAYVGDWSEMHAANVNTVVNGVVTNNYIAKRVGAQLPMTSNSTYDRMRTACDNYTATMPAYELQPIAMPADWESVWVLDYATPPAP
jgi:hypothetical protein